MENVDFKDDSDDDTEWAPTPEDVLLVDESNPVEKEQPGKFSCTECDLKTKYEFSLIRHRKCYDRGTIKRVG